MTSRYMSPSLHGIPHEKLGTTTNPPPLPSLSNHSQSAITMKLTPENAQQLLDAGAFVVFSDLPAGTEVGIDGECV